MSKMPISILFVCTENACRSQMAEAFARSIGGNSVEAHSAGSRPRGSIDDTVVKVMLEKGVDLSANASKGLADLPQRKWDVVVSMGCGDSCPSVLAVKHFGWQIPDPKGNTIDIYRQVRDLVESAVKMLLEQVLA